ncbi:hypothetical protein PACG_01025 [Pseudomonas aeruginosa C3719]|nr:hypothetical protein PACG_01025 [Pseudomonas aeruginosa C3719]
MHPTPRLAAALLAGSGLGWPLLAQADLVEDSHASLELRNFYFNRDFRQSGARDNADEWAQGFLLRLESGFSEGTVGFGVDAIGLLGFKLDSGGGSGGTGLLPADGSAGGSQDDYAKLGLTAKARVSNSLLKVGALHFKSPLVSANDTRLLPELFRSALLDVQRSTTDLRARTLDRNKLTAPATTRCSAPTASAGAAMLRLRRRRLSPDPGADRQPAPGSAQGHLPADVRRPGTHPRPRRTAFAQERPALRPGQRGRRLPRTGQPRLRRPLQPAPGRPRGGRRLPADQWRRSLSLHRRQRPVPGQLHPDRRLRQRRRAFLATALRLRFRRARPARPELHEPLRLRRQRRPRRGQRRQGMGTQHRPRLRGAERAAEEPRGEMAQRHGAFEFRQRPRRKSPDPQLQPDAVVRSGEQ